MASFISNTVKILSGQIIAIGISILTLPVITRIYEPHSYGVYLIVTAVVIIVTPLGGFGFETAILLPKSRRTLINIIAVAFCGVVGGALVLFLLILIANDWLTNVFGLPDGSNFLLLVPVIVALLGFSRLLMFMLIRENVFSHQGVSRVIEAIIERLVGITGGMISPNAWWLITARIIGLGAGTLTLAHPSWKVGREVGLQLRWVRGRFFATCRRYRRFVLSAFANMLNAISRELPVLLLGIVFSPDVVSFYGLGRVVIGRPLTIIADSLSRAVFQKASESKRGGKDTKKLAIDLLRYPLSFVLPPTIVIILISDQLVPLLFGENWQSAAVYLQVMVAALVSMFINRPLSIFYEIMEKQKIRLILNIVLIIGIVGAVLLGGLGNNPVISVGLIAIVSFCIDLAGVFYLMNILGVGYLSTFKVIVGVTKIAAVFMFPMLLCKVFAGDSILCTSAAAGIGLIGYYYYMVKNSTVLSQYAARLLRWRI